MHSSPIKSLRRYIRIPFNAAVRLKVHEQAFSVQLVDIALKGALVQCASTHALVLHAPCRLLLPMAEDGDGIIMGGRVAHLDGELVGIECTEIDVTSLTRLRRLIELNAGDPGLMHRELRQLIAANAPGSRAG